jgi:hypothetical protein
MQESSISTVRIEWTAHPVPSGGVFGRSERLCDVFTFGSELVKRGLALVLPAG